jgi:hypothetical protein
MAIICHASNPQVISPSSNFWEVLRKWQHIWLWENLQWVGDDDWLVVAYNEESCIAVTDGSYMKDLYPKIHSAAVVLKCTRGRGRIWCSFTEGSRVSCSYHGKLVGLMAIHLILLALQGSVHFFLNALGLWIRSGTCLPQELPLD